MGEKKAPFTQLDPSRRQIRLLHLEPDPSDLRATLIVVSLDDGPQYTALSYVWGTELCDADDGITLAGQPPSRVRVTRNLAVALRHLAATTTAGVVVVPLWVDALCIDQRDAAEKSHQITLMRDVYAGAVDTCVWLGPAAEDSDVAMAAVGDLHERRVYALPDGALSEAQVAAINALQGREWWSRIWVLQGECVCVFVVPPSSLCVCVQELLKKIIHPSQEVMLSRNPIMTCGGATLPFDAFVHLDDVRRGYVRPERRYLGNSEAGDRLAIRGNAFRAVLTDYPDDKPKVAAGAVPLCEWTPSVDTFAATDQRDKIYGLLWLARPQDVSAVAPDYSQSVAQVYARAAALFVAQTQSLLWLQFDRDNVNPVHELPSWCPDYSSDPAWPRRGYVAATGEGYRAGGAVDAPCWGGASVPSSPSPSLSPSPPPSWREMRLRGLHVDTVERVGPNPYMAPYAGHVLAERAANVAARAAQTRANVLRWEAMAAAKWDSSSSSGNGEEGFPYGRLGMGRGEALWRTLMRDRGWHRARVEAGFGRYFDVWLGRAEYAEGGRRSEEARRDFVRPFTDCCISRCHGRSFIVTEKGYIGTAPFKTRVGDKVVALQGGAVPFIIREQEVDFVQGSGGQPEDAQYEFVGEAFVLGIMEGQAIDEACPEDTRVFVLS
ncbi:hypothetical protein RB593_006944 [Gaeumannomyces tritici]